MPKFLTVTEAVRNFSEILGRVRFQRERFVLTKGGKPVAELGPTTFAARVCAGELPAILAELPHLEPEEAERFAQDLETMRQTIGLIPPSGPWAS